jgi:adenylate cyclase class 2
MATTILEREIKLQFGSADEARAAVSAAGCTPLLGRRLQEDALLDTEDELLRRRRCVLRVRVENGKSRVTYKGPVQPSAMKLREELETLVGDGEVLLRVFGELGLHVWFRYEKYREEFSHEDVIVAIDETPVGVFVEIEGGEQGIAAMTTALGRSASDYIVDSYRSIFLQRREEFGLNGPDMLFDPCAP